MMICTNFGTGITEELLRRYLNSVVFLVFRGKLKPLYTYIKPIKAYIYPQTETKGITSLIIQVNRTLTFQ